LFSDGSLPELHRLKMPAPDRIFQMTGHAVRLKGRESIGSRFGQAPVAQRQKHPTLGAATLVEAALPNWRGAAGLTTCYRRHKFHAVLLTQGDRGRDLQKVSCLGDWPDERLIFDAVQPLPARPIRPKVRVTAGGAAVMLGKTRCRTGGAWRCAGGVDHPERRRAGAHALFAGAFAATLAYDLTGQGRTADFPASNHTPA